MRALLLAAGFATRLHPLTIHRAKPLLEVGGRPVIDHVLERLEPLDGLEEVLVVTNDHFHADFVAWRDARPSAIPLRLLNDGTRTNDERRGGVGDLALGLAALEESGSPSSVLVVAGDNILRFSLAPFVAEFRRRRRPLLLARRYPGPVPPRRHGEVCVDGDGRITRLREKPDRPESDLVAVCLYAFPAGVSAQVRRYLDEGGNRDAPGHFLAWLADRTEVYAHAAEGEVLDIGDRASLEAARRLFP